MLYLSTFGLEFEKAIFIFEINALQFVSSQNFVKKQKCLNLRQKMLYLGIFELEFENNFVIFEINTLHFA